MYLVSSINRTHPLIITNPSSLDFTLGSVYQLIELILAVIFTGVLLLCNEFLWNHPWSFVMIILHGYLPPKVLLCLNAQNKQTIPEVKSWKFLIQCLLKWFWFKFHLSTHMNHFFCQQWCLQGPKQRPNPAKFIVLIKSLNVLMLVLASVVSIVDNYWS